MVEALRVEGDERDGEKDNNENQGEEHTSLSLDKAGVNLPKVAIWYRNEVMKVFWMNASSSQ